MHKGTVWSCFLLHEDGTWTQPTYRLSRFMSEATFMQKAMEKEGRKYFAVCGICQDPDCPEENIQNL